MVLAIVIIILILSWAIQQYKAGVWRRDRLNDKPNYTNTYLDYFGLERDRRTNEPRFFGNDMSGDRIMYDKNRNAIKNLSMSVENDKFTEQLPKAKENGQKTVELDFLPSESIYKTKYFADKKYKDVDTKANYILIKGDNKRGMDLAYYYFDYQKDKVVCPSDGFIKRFHNESLCPVYNTRTIHHDSLSWDDVLAEIPKLQEDIDKNGLKANQVCHYGDY